MAIWLLRCVPRCQRSRSSPPLILFNKNHYLISATKQLSHPTMSAHIEAVITRPGPPCRLPPRPCGAIMGKGENQGLSLSARIWQERKRGTLPRALSHILIVFTLSRWGERLPETKPKQVGARGPAARSEGGVWINSTSTRTKRKWGEKTIEAR